MSLDLDQDAGVGHVAPLLLAAVFASACGRSWLYDQGDPPLPGSGSPGSSGGSPGGGCGPVSFGKQTTFPAGQDLAGVAVGDFNGDGKPDVAVLGDDVEVLLGTGTGSFGAPLVSPTGIGGIAPVAADFDQDGKLDLAFVSPSPVGAVGALWVALGSGTGSFGAPTSFGGWDDPVAAAVGDFNGDGHVDVAVADESDDTVSVLLGDGAGSFGAPTSFGVGHRPVSLAVLDSRGDGRLDLATANGDGTVSLLLGTGAGSFGLATSFEVGNLPLALSVGDFNGDGRSDLAVVNESDYVSVLLGTGTGSFGPQTTFSAGSSAFSIAVADFNGDGVLDLAVGSILGGSSPELGSVSVLLGIGNGSFCPQSSFSVGEIPGPLAIGAFDGAHGPDIVVPSTADGTVGLLLDQ